MTESKTDTHHALTGEAAAVVQAATRLLKDLQHGYSVFSAVLGLQRVLADLEVVERRKYNQRQRDAIEHAAGLAATHVWELVDSRIRCTRCPVDVGTVALTHGAVPECNPNTRCAPFATRHFIAGDRCTYCETDYPATAETGGEHR